MPKIVKAAMYFDKRLHHALTGAHMRRSIRKELEVIVPIDALEQEHLAKALAWVDSGTELCRKDKPATPPMHLVSYIIVVDHKHVLLVDHRKARLWLPAGGHVEPGEHPRETVLREFEEELGLTAVHAIEDPIMVTCTETVGLAAGHTDVSLWYVIHANRRKAIKFDDREFRDVHWFPFAEMPLRRSDPHLGRFIEKLRSCQSLEQPVAR